MNAMRPAMQHRRGRSLSSMAKDRDEDLALFQEMQKRERQGRNAIHSPHDNAEALAANNVVSSPVHLLPTLTSAETNCADDLLTSDFGKNDYEWLLTPPATPLFTPTDQKVPDAGFTPKVVPVARSLAPLKTSRLTEPAAKSQPSAKIEPSSKLVRGSLGLRQVNSSSSLSSSNAANRRSSLTPSSNTASRPSTPSGSASIPSSTRSNSSSRSSTPLKRPTTPKLQSHPVTSTSGSSSVNKSRSLPSISAVSSRGSSPSTRSRTRQPSGTLGVSSEPPCNLRTTLPERPTSNKRGASIGARPGGLTSGRTARGDATDSSIGPRRQSCSPSVTRGRLTPNAPSSSGSIQHNGKLHDVPAGVSGNIVMGSKMVEKVMQVRRSTELVQNDHTTRTEPNSEVKCPAKSVPLARESSGFGRNLSRKSLDMAIWHMDIRRSTPNGFRPLMSKVPASSLYSVRSSRNQDQSVNVAVKSPMATSSNASSELSMSIMQDPEGSELDDEEVSSKRGSHASPLSQPDSVGALSKEWRLSNWIGSPDYRDDSVELMQFFRQGIEKYSESPLVCQHDGASECDLCKLGLDNTLQ